MAFYNPDIIKSIKNIDLLTYLQIHEPDNLVKFNRDTYCTKEHDSLKISNGMWYWFSRGFGGVSALDYLVKVKNIPFIEAVEILLNKVGDISQSQYNFVKKKKPKKIILPDKNGDNNKIIQYLLSRKIDQNIIEECISKELIYEDKNHNIVFLGYDKFNSIKYAFIRGTNKTRYMREAYGSHKAFSFKIDSYEKSDTLHLFESAIDLLSYASIYKEEYYKENLLSLAGVYQVQKNIEDSKLPLSLNYYLNQNQNIKKIILHLDNDEVGRGATKALLFLLQKYYIVIDESPPIGKDYNDYLQYSNDRKNKFKGSYER